MMYWVCAGILAIAYGLYMYNKVVNLAYSRICEDSKLSKFVLAFRNEVKRVDGGKDYVYGFKSKDNKVNFYVYLDKNDSRVDEFDKIHEIMAFVDYLYIEDYFLFAKDKIAFRMLGETPFAMVSGITCLDYRDVEIFSHEYHGIGDWTKIPFSKNNAEHTLKRRLGVNRNASEYFYR